MKMMNKMVRSIGVIIFLIVFGVFAKNEEIVFDADFELSRSVTNTLDQTDLSADYSSGLTNLNTGTRVGHWGANTLGQSAIYSGFGGNKILFLAKATYDVEAYFSKPVSIKEGIDISFDFAICRIMKKDRENYLSGIDGSGRTVFKLLFSGNRSDDGGQTLYLVTPVKKILIASNIRRISKSTFAHGSRSLGHLSIHLDTTGIIIFRNGTELIRDIPIYDTEGSSFVSRLRFVGDTMFFDDIKVTGGASSGLDAKQSSMILGVSLVF